MGGSQESLGDLKKEGNRTHPYVFSLSGSRVKVHHLCVSRKRHRFQELLLGTWIVYHKTHWGGESPARVLSLLSGARDGLELCLPPWSDTCVGPQTEALGLRNTYTLLLLRCHTKVSLRGSRLQASTSLLIVYIRVGKLELLGYSFPLSYVLMLCRTDSLPSSVST